MKLLETIKEKDVIADYSEKEDISYKLREAVRTVLFDSDNKIALLKVSKMNYYKLPGGGIEDDENEELALRRECKEETGCDIKIGEDIGMIEEYRDKINIHQKSYCWISELQGEKGNTEFTKKEKSEGFCLKWVKLDEAINLIKDSKPMDYEGQFIVVRDLRFLKETKVLLSSLD